MHKKLASDLTSLAHSILRMNNKDDVFELKQKAHEVYEKLSVLAYVEEYINNTPNPTRVKEDLLQDILIAEESKKESLVAQESIEEKIEVKGSVEEVTLTITSEEVVVAEEIIASVEEENIEELVEITEQPFDELEGLLFDENNSEKNDVKDVGERKTPTLEDELQGTISVDVMADLFEKAVPKKSLNDRLQGAIQIDLNDRIAFVKHLFEGSQSDFNRVVSQLNTFKTGQEAKKFVNKMIKPDYDWSDKEEYESRLFEIIERRFL